MPGGRDPLTLPAATRTPGIAQQHLSGSAAGFRGEDLFRASDQVRTGLR
jgi:hypothetical protein